MVDQAADPIARAFPGPDDAGPLELSKPGHHALSHIDIPIVTVDITQSGAAPVELETQVTKRVEDSVAGVTNVKHIKSSITDGASMTTIEFQLGTNTDRAVNDVKDAVSKVRQELPRTINEPIIQRLDIEGLPIVTYGASAPSMTLEQLSWFIDDTVARKLQGVRGVAQVTRVGGVKREIRVSLIPERLLALGITAGEVNQQLRATNTDLAGGRGEVAGRSSPSARSQARALSSGWPRPRSPFRAHARFASINWGR